MFTLSEGRLKRGSGWRCISLYGSAGEPIKGRREEKMGVKRKGKGEGEGEGGREREGKKRGGRDRGRERERRREKAERRKGKQRERGKQSIPQINLLCDN